MVVIYLSLYKEPFPLWVDTFLQDKYVLANRWIILEPLTSFSFYEKHESVYGVFLKRTLNDTECQILKNVVDPNIIRKSYLEVKKYLLEGDTAENTQWIRQRIWKVARSHVMLIDGSNNGIDTYSIFDAFLASVLNIPVILINTSCVLDLSYCSNCNIVVLPTRNIKEIVRQILAFTMIEELLCKK